MLLIESVDHLMNQVEQEDYVVVDFRAEWCGPCQSIEPHVEDLSQEYDSVVFAKVDIEEVPDLAKEYQVQSIPTFVAFEEEREVNRQQTSNPSTLADFVEDLVE